MAGKNIARVIEMFQRAPIDEAKQMLEAAKAVVKGRDGGAKASKPRKPRTVATEGV